MGAIRHNSILKRHWMLHLELSLSNRVQLIGLLAVALVALLTRAMIFIHREKASIQPIYPSGWSAAQCRVMERFRLLIGLALLLFWGAFLLIAPSVATTNKWPLGIFLDNPIWATTIFIAPTAPPNWPLGYYLNGMFIVFMLLISNAWVLLLIPRNWKRFGAITRSFRVTIAFLVIWWGVTLTATGWILAKAAAPSPPVHVIFGVYAARGLPSLFEISLI